MNRPLPRIHFEAAIIAGLADHYRNWDDLSRDGALGKLKSGQSAWWTTAGIGNAAAGNLMSEANRLATLEDAFVAIEDFYERTHCVRNIRAEQWLDTLIPLNAAAIRELDDAYRVAGTFRSREELEARSGLDLAQVA